MVHAILPPSCRFNNSFVPFLLVERYLLLTREQLSTFQHTFGKLVPLRTQKLDCSLPLILRVYIDGECSKTDELYDFMSINAVLSTGSRRFGFIREYKTIIVVFHSNAYLC